MARKMLDHPLNNSSADGHGAGEHFEYDLFTIGAGSGGVRASRMSASLGAKVGICELPFDPISSECLGGCGGTCVIRGCVPKKILVYGACFHGEFEDSKQFGWDIHGDITFDWKRLIANKNKEITRLNGIYGNILKNAGVSIFEGGGKVIDPHTVEVKLTDGQVRRFTAKHILIATGCRAVILDIPGKELAITSDEALNLEEFPKRSVIVGGGYIAVEFAGIYNGMGSKVNLLYRKEEILRGFDHEMRCTVAKNLENRGVALHPVTNITKIEKVDGGLKVYIDGGAVMETDIVLFAVGRKPNSKRLNLEAVGVELSKDGAVKVDEYSQTSVPSIWAVGDVTERLALTPVALMEGTCLAKTLFGGQKVKPDYNHVPSAVFSIPPLAVVGLSEEEAVAQAKNDIIVYTSSFNPMKNTISGRQEKTLMKLIVDSVTDKVIGAGMCGPDAAEIMQGIAIALKCGATKAQFDATVGLHPSAAEELVTMRTPTRRVSCDGQVKKV